ncbi:MAG: ribbon-helix-helix protein, CopG family [Alphaproteobacteria bacterium]
MARTSAEPNADIITVRIPAALKTALAEIAREEAKPVGELLRDLIRERVRQKERREFEAEARRECLVLNAAARDPNSDEAAVMRELDANFDELARDLAAGEAAADAKRSRKWK